MAENAWEETSRKATDHTIHERYLRVEGAIGTLTSQLQSGDPIEAVDVHRARQNLAWLRHHIEELIVPHVDGLEKYDNGLEPLSYREIADAINVDSGDLMELVNNSE